MYVEVSKTLEAPPDLKLCQDKIEQFIYGVNETYKEFRQANSIGSPEVKLLQTDTFKMLKNKLLLKGTSDSQFKMPRLLKNSDSVDFLESMVIYQS